MRIILVGRLLPLVCGSPGVMQRADSHLLGFLCSFFGQWGPNATTWLLPSELFPTETRAMSHGLAAATGKV